MSSTALWSNLVCSFFATLILTTILDAGRAFGFTRMDIPFLIGTSITAHRDRAKSLGFLLHLLNGWILAGAYLALLRAARLEHWWFGLIIGFFHGAFILLVVTELLPAIHPRMASEEEGPDPTKQLEPPGGFALNYGRATPIVTMLAHLLYGGALGLFLR